MRKDFYMELLRRVLFGRKGLLLAALLGVALLGIPSQSASAAPIAAHPSLQQQIQQQLHRKPGGVQISANRISYDNGKIIVAFASPDAVTLASGYGGCPNGYICVWNGTGYSGSGVFFNGQGCSGGVDLQVSYGFTGVRSYSSTDGATLTGYLYDIWGNYDFNILPGSAHHSSDTSSNSDAQYARYFYRC